MTYVSTTIPDVRNMVTFFISRISRLRWIIKSWIFSQKMRREKLYQNCMIEFLFTYSNVFSYTQNEQCTWQCHSSSSWKCLKSYSDSLYELVHTTFVELSTAHLFKRIQYSIISSSRDIWKTKKYFKHFQYDEKWHCHVGSSFWV